MPPNCRWLIIFVYVCRKQQCAWVCVKPSVYVYSIPVGACLLWSVTDWPVVHFKICNNSSSSRSVGDWCFPLPYTHTRLHDVFLRVCAAAAAGPSQSLSRECTRAHKAPSEREQRLTVSQLDMDLFMKALGVIAAAAFYITPKVNVGNNWKMMSSAAAAVAE